MCRLSEVGRTVVWLLHERMRAREIKYAESHGYVYCSILSMNNGNRYSRGYEYGL